MSNVSIVGHFLFRVCPLIALVEFGVSKLVGKFWSLILSNPKAAFLNSSNIIAKRCGPNWFNGSVNDMVCTV